MNLLVSFSMNDILLNSFVAISVVFLALLILVCVFMFIGKMSINLSKKRSKKQGVSKEMMTDISGGDVAAISMALHLYFDDAHDQESNVITIKSIQRRYSPWNSKIYGITNLNR